MIGDGADLRDVTTLPKLLARTPSGEAVAQLAERLGLLTENSLCASSARRPFVNDISTLVPARLSAEQSHWAGEFGRIVELIGLLQSQEKFLALRIKGAKASARSRVRRDAETTERKVTAGQVTDEADEDPNVREVEEQSMLVAEMLAVAMASKEATTLYLSVISREISFRCAQMDAKIY